MRTGSPGTSTQTARKLLASAGTGSMSTGNLRAGSPERREADEGGPDLEIVGTNGRTRSPDAAHLPPITSPGHQVVDGSPQGAAARTQGGSAADLAATGAGRTPQSRGQQRAHFSPAAGEEATTESMFADGVCGTSIGPQG